MPETAQHSPEIQREIRLVRLEEGQKSISQDIAEVKSELGALRSDLFDEIRADRKSRERCATLLASLLKPIATPQVAISFAVLLGLIIIGAMGLNAQWGDVVVGAGETFIEMQDDAADDGASLLDTDSGA